MTAKRKPVKATITRGLERTPLAPTALPARSYPRLADILREPAFSSMLRGAVLGAAALSAVTLSGCEPPECQPTRLGELGTHGSEAFSLLLQLEPKSSMTALAVGFGLSPHPASFAMGGAVAVVMPAPAPPPPPAPNTDDADDTANDEPTDEPGVIAAPPSGPSLPFEAGPQS